MIGPEYRAACLQYTGLIGFTVGASCAIFLLRRASHRISWVLALAWAVVFVNWHSRLSDRLYYAASLGMAKSANGPVDLYLAIIPIYVGACVFLLVSMVLLWPHKQRSLGYEIRRTVLWLVPVGIATGVLQALLPKPQYLLWFAGNPQSAFSALALALALPSAVLQEVVYRQRLMTALSSAPGMSPMLVIAVQSVLFAAMHLPMCLRFDVSLSRTVIYIAQVFACGLLWGWLRYRTGNLWLSSAAHTANNMIAIVSATWV